MLRSFIYSYQPDDAHNTPLNSLALHLQQLGDFLTCFLVSPFTNCISRRHALMLSSVVVVVGATIQTINTDAMGAFYTATIIAGVGIGAENAFMRIYNNDMTRKDLRGRVGSFFSPISPGNGIFVSYRVVYTIPIGLHIVPAALLVLDLALDAPILRNAQNGLHEREDIKRHRRARMICVDESQAVLDKMQEMRTDVEIEERGTESFQIKGIAEWHNFMQIFAVFTAPQATGATACRILWAAILQALVEGGDKVVEGSLGAFFLSEQVACRQVLIWRAACMAAWQTSTPTVIRNISAPQMEEVASRPNVAVGASSQWFFNYVRSLVAPNLIEDVGWDTFLSWSLLVNIIAIEALAFLSLPKDLPLDEIALHDNSHVRLEKHTDPDQMAQSGWKRHLHRCNDQ
ncbi:hypothetical protein CC80DRAFT_523126 [Byssothecium circinans]|uniref:MFS general substrate transporter n=1 Tax=Byssothecium circinans TaxID=147558 RepID=A0A6A5U803_9PLEO|nr:hypothetical protein CC80DRAFT_523126 [Byssothecium circinans]